MPGLEDIVPQVIVEGIEEAVAQFEKLGAAGSQAFAQIIQAAASGNFTPIITHVFGELAGTIAEATKAVSEFVDAQAQMAETLSNLAQATGMTIPEIEGLRDAFASVGITTSGFERSLGRLAMTIGREWTAIQQSVRTAADQQEGAMLNMQSATLGVEKAHERLSDAIANSSRAEEKDALGIEQASLSYQRAIQNMTDAANASQHNANSVESAQLALRRAELNVQKDRGVDTSGAEKQLKMEQDQLAVKEAQLRVEDAQKKSASEALDMRAKQLAVEKASMEVADAQRKQMEDRLHGITAIREAELAVEKAKLAQREAAEKMHEMDLRDIPSITRQVKQVADGYKEWDTVLNHTELSAQNLSKAIILASSGGAGGGAPKSNDVLMETAKLFEHMGTTADASAKKLEIVQHLMAAGFRSGQASAAQMEAILSRGPKFFEDMKAAAEKFQKTGIGFKDEDAAKLKEFNETWTQLDSLISQVQGHMAAVIAPAFIAFFKEVKESLQDSGGALHRFAQAISTVVEFMANIVTGIEKLIGALDKLKGMPSIVSQMFPNLSAALSLMEAMNKFVASKSDKPPESPIQNSTGRRMSVLDPEFSQQAGQKLDTSGDKLSAAADKHEQAAITWQGIGAMLLQVLASVATKGAVPLPGMATGGLVRGPGSQTSDTAGMFPLSDGEYVVRAAAVSHYGADLFEAMNSLAVRGFASGGMVGAARAASVPAGANAGPSSILNLTIDGQHFNGLRAPENVASRLKTYAVTRLSSQAGPSPSWRR